MLARGDVSAAAPRKGARSTQPHRRARLPRQRSHAMRARAGTSAQHAQQQPRRHGGDAAGARARNADEIDGDARAAHASVMRSIDRALSNRFIALDPAGYFVIRARGDAIEARHYKNVIGEDGLARDPTTNEVIPCDGSYKPVVNAEFTGRTAKEISVKIFERDGEDVNDGVCTMMSHANYLGREFQRAEWCIRHDVEYVQD